MNVAAIATSNRDQAQAWDGEEGTFWSTHPRQFADVLEYYEPAYRLACDVQAHDRVLDVGCGTGDTTLAAARLATVGDVLGVDLSARMLQVAEESARDEGLSNVRFEQADAQVHPFEPQGFDLAMSRTGAMFFGDPQEAFTNLRRALQPEGRLVLLNWRSVEENPWMSEFATVLLGQAPGRPPAGAPGPFSLSDPDHVRSLLTGAGFAHIELTAVTGPVTYGRDVDEAHELLTGVLGWMVETREPQDRVPALTALRRSLEAHLDPDGVRYDSAMWLVTARAGGRGL